MIRILKPEKYEAAIYARLSDENKMDNLESGSISTQKIFLNDFCKENNIKIHDIYVDDGYSGANFERPSFKRMIRDLEDKKINMVITKDLSRFGRVSAKVDYYLEEYFVEKDVRFIAVCDDIDTGDKQMSYEMAQFKAFFNEWFLRDCSKKVKNGKRARAKEGKVMVTYPAYGYKKDPSDKNHYIVDEKIAPIVIKIFELARKGITPTQIAKIMTEEKQELPCDIVGNIHTRTNDEIKRRWNRNTIMRILKNIVYLGYVRNGMNRKINYKTKKKITLPEEEWIIVKEKHDPIIDIETFNLVQEQIKSRMSTRIKKHDWLLKGIIECKECGKKLSICPHKQRNGKTIYYLRCNTYAAATSLKLCTSHNNNLDKVTDTILKVLKEKIIDKIDESELLKKANELKKDYERNSNNNKNAKRILKQNITKINYEIDKLYEDKCSKTLKKEDFDRIYQKNITKREGYMEEIEKLKLNDSNKNFDIDIKIIVNDFLTMEKITRNIIVQLIDKIQINDDKKIIVYYKFKNE